MRLNIKEEWNVIFKKAIKSSMIALLVYSLGFVFLIVVAGYRDHLPASYFFEKRILAIYVHFGGILLIQWFCLVALAEWMMNKIDGILQRNKKITL